MLNARSGRSSTLLGDGRVVVAGGNLPGRDGAQTRTAEIYDPATGDWTPTGRMKIPRSFFSATRLADGRILVAGGLTVPNSTRTATAEIFDPTTGTWTLTGSMTVARGGLGMARESLLLANGNVLVAGDAVGDRSASAELYDPASGTWRSVAVMSVDRRDFAAVELADGRVLIAGGVTHDRIVLATVENDMP